MPNDTSLNATLKIEAISINNSPKMHLFRVVRLVARGEKGEVYDRPGGLMVACKGGFLG